MFKKFFLLITALMICSAMLMARNTLGAPSTSLAAASQLDVMPDNVGELPGFSHLVNKSFIYFNYGQFYDIKAAYKISDSLTPFIGLYFTDSVSANYTDSEQDASKDITSYSIPLNTASSTNHINISSDKYTDTKDAVNTIKGLLGATFDTGSMILSAYYLGELNNLKSESTRTEISKPAPALYSIGMTDTNTVTTSKSDNGALKNYLNANVLLNEKIVVGVGASVDMYKGKKDDTYEKVTTVSGSNQIASPVAYGELIKTTVTTTGGAAAPTAGNEPRTVVEADGIAEFIDIVGKWTLGIDATWKKYWITDEGHATHETKTVTDYNSGYFVTNIVTINNIVITNSTNTIAKDGSIKDEATTLTERFYEMQPLNYSVAVYGYTYLKADNALIKISPKLSYMRNSQEYYEKTTAKQKITADADGNKKSVVIEKENVRYSRVMKEIKNTYALNTYIDTKVPVSERLSVLGGIEPELKYVKTKTTMTPNSKASTDTAKITDEAGVVASDSKTTYGKYKDGAQTEQRQFTGSVAKTLRLGLEYNVNDQLIFGVAFQPGANINTSTAGIDVTYYFE